MTTLIDMDKVVASIGQRLCGPDRSISQHNLSFLRMLDRAVHGQKLALLKVLIAVAAFGTLTVQLLVIPLHQHQVVITKLALDSENPRKPLCQSGSYHKAGDPRRREDLEHGARMAIGRHRLELQEQLREDCLHHLQTAKLLWGGITKVVGGALTRGSGPAAAGTAA